MSISNKLLALFILVVIFGLSTIFVLYFFIYNTGTLVINSNIGGYKIELNSPRLSDKIASKINDKLNKNCDTKTCTLADLPPFEYSYFIYKDGYKTKSSTLKVIKNEVLKIDINLIKEVSLKKIEEKKISLKNKINKIKNQKLLAKNKLVIAYFDLGKNGIFYFKKSEGLLDCISGNKVLFSIPEVPKNMIKMQVIEGTNKFIIEAENKFIYDMNTSKLTKINFHIPIKYAKKSIFPEILFVTEKGTFLYNYTKKTFDYFNLFRDFIFFKENSYLGILYSSDIKRKKDLGINSPNNIVIRYNYKTKEKNIIMRLDFEPSKIINENGIIYIYDKKNNKFKLENITK